MNALTEYDRSNYITILSNGFISNTLWLDIVLIIILLICFVASFFFSLAETSLSSANLIRLQKLVEEKKRGSRKAELLIENYDRTITTILIGNNLANIGASTISVFIFTKMIQQNLSLANILSTVVMTLLIITFGEIIPKTYAKANATNTSVKISGLLWLFFKLFYPLSYLFMKLSSKIRRNSQSEDSVVTNEELETIIDNMEHQGIIDEDHADLLQGALTLGNKKVFEIMTHRVDVVGIEINDSIDDILKKFFETNYTRLLVYKENKDNTLGILQERDFLREILKVENKNNIDIKDIISEPLYVPKTTRVDDLIKELQEAKKHFAVVADEFGGTNGIVTMEDALEELVGEIYDEYDLDEDGSYMKIIGPNLYSMSVDFDLKELFEKLDVGNVPTDSFKTVGSYIYYLSEGLLEKDKIIDVISSKTTYDEEKIIETKYKLSFKLAHVENRRIMALEVKVDDITNTGNQSIENSDD